MYPLRTDTRMYSLPLRDRTGRRPVRSEWLVCEMGMTLRKAWLESSKVRSVSFRGIEVVSDDDVGTGELGGISGMEGDVVVDVCCEDVECWP